jgi:hypothetical protein
MARSTSTTARAQAQQQHKHNHRSTSTTAAHAQQQHHCWCTGKSSTPRQWMPRHPEVGDEVVQRTGEREEEEYTPGRADGKRGHGGHGDTCQTQGGAKPGQARPRRAPQRSAWHVTSLDNARTSLVHRRRAVAVTVVTLDATGGSRKSRRR